MLYELKQNNKSLEICNLFEHWSRFACLKDNKDFSGAGLSLLQFSFCKLLVDDI